eukprot:g3968.t1 g3968   contig15:46810-47232(-)
METDENEVLSQPRPRNLFTDSNSNKQPSKKKRATNNPFKTAPVQGTLTQNKRGMLALERFVATPILDKRGKKLQGGIKTWDDYGGRGAAASMSEGMKESGDGKNVAKDAKERRERINKQRRQINQSNPKRTMDRVRLTLY